MGSKEKPAAINHGDDLMPLHAFDDTALNRIMVVTGLFRYNSVLDADLLQNSLTELLHIGDWKKLRGRLRLNDQDKLEVHVPTKATRQRPAIRFRQTVFGQSIKSHPLIAKLAQSRGMSAIQPAIANLDGISSVIIPPDWPRTLDDYVDAERDEPILGLHVLSFTDATIVILAFCHVMMDGGGLESLLRAWSDVLHGNKEAVKPMEGARVDPLDSIRKAYGGREACVLADQKIDLGSLMPEDGAAPPSDPDWNTSSPESRWRTLSLSPSALALLKREASNNQPTRNGSPAFFSEDDIVTAWIVRSVARMYPAARPVNMMRLYDLRRRLPVFKSDAAYIQNAYQMAWSLFPSAGELGSAPLGEIASRLREELVSQTREAQAVAAMAEREGGNTPLFGNPAGAFFTLNSWVRMNLYERADFTPAVVGAEESLEVVKAVPPGQPEFIDFDFALGGAPPGPNVISSGKDATGTRHAMAFLSNVMWPKLEAELQKLG